MKQLDENIWIKGYPLNVFGTRHGRNVTVMRLKSGKLIIHSMAPFPGSDVEGMRRLGEPGWLVESMLHHDTYARDGREIFQDIPFLGPPGFSAVVNFPTEPLYPAPFEWEGEVESIPVDGVPKFEEIAVLHLSSRTLILADLLFNFPADEGGWNKFVHQYAIGMKRYPAVGRPFKMCISDKAAFRASMDEILSKDFDRIIVGHGNVIERDGKNLMKRALSDAGVY